MQELQARVPTDDLGWGRHPSRKCVMLKGLHRFSLSRDALAGYWYHL